MSIKYTYCLTRWHTQAVHAIGERSPSDSCVATRGPVKELRPWTVERAVRWSNRLASPVLDLKTSALNDKFLDCDDGVLVPAHRKEPAANRMRVFLTPACRPRPLSAFSQTGTKYSVPVANGCKRAQTFADHAKTPAIPPHARGGSAS